MALEEAQPFIWGGGGSRLTPEQIDAQRKVARAMMEKGMDYSPIQSWTQGGARVSQALLGAMESREADDAAKTNAVADREMIASLINGGATPAAPAATSTAPTGAPASPSVPTDKGGFVASMMPMAVEASKQTGVDPKIIVAQAALESGWGKSALGNNFFGIKSHGQPGGNVLPTTEVVNGQPVQTQDSFRAYGSPQDSVNGYTDFINKNPRYAALKTAQGTDAQIAALGQSGYASDPQYGAKIASIVRGLPGDQPAQPAAQPATDQPVQMAQNAPVPRPTGQPAQAKPAVNQAVIATLTSPYASPAAKSIAQMMLKEQMGSPEFVPIGDNAILNKKSGSIIPVDVPKKTNEIRNYEVYSQQERSAGREPMSLIDHEIKLKQAGAMANNVTLNADKTGAEHLASKAVEGYDNAMLASRESQKRIALYDTLDKAAQGFTPGATADMRLTAKRYLKDAGLISGTDVPDGEIMQMISRSLAIHAQPKGQGAVSNYERELYANSLPNMSQSPEGLKTAIGINRKLEQFDQQVAQIYRDSARQSPHGIPNYLQVQDKIAGLGSPLDDKDMMELKKAAPSSSPSQSGSTASGKTKSGISWSVK